MNADYTLPTVPRWYDHEIWQDVCLSSSTSSVTEQDSIFDGSLPSSSNSCTSFDLDPTPSSSLDSQVSGRSYHGSPSASFFYPLYLDTDVHFVSPFFPRFSPDPLSAEEDLISPSESSTSLSDFSNGGYFSDECLPFSGFYHPITFDSPASPTNSFTNLLHPADDDLDTPVVEIPLNNVYGYILVPGQQDEVSVDKKRKREEDEDGDEDVLETHYPKRCRM